MTVVNRSALQLAAMAKENPALIPNHLGTVDRLLKAELDNTRFVIDRIKHDPTSADWVADMRREAEELEEALTVYGYVKGERP